MTYICYVSAYGHGFWTRPRPVHRRLVHRRRGRRRHRRCRCRRQKAAVTCIRSVKQEPTSVRVYTTKSLGNFCCQFDFFYQAQNH